MEKLKNLNKKVVAVAGILLGAFAILGIRFVTYAAPAETHYHANFAVYINGERELFSNPLIYEEISSCKVETVEMMTPGERAHLHDKVNDVVHVEDEAVTWGNFFQNIGWNANSRYLDNSSKILVNDDTNKVTFILNGEEINDPTTRVIDSKDRLLVSYGTSTKDELKKQYDTIATTAEKYNTTKDPASCSGGHSSGGIKDRMKHLF
jgi:predicted lactoylglutathione lyase